MKELLRLSWVLLVHYISCCIAGWETAVTLFILLMVMIWYAIFACINYVVRKKKGLNRSKDVSPLIYMLVSVPALISPLLAVFIFMMLSIYRLCAIASITVGDTPFREQFVFDRSYQVDAFPYEAESKDAVTTGLPICGTLEPAGNPYGVWGAHRSHNSSDS